MSENIHKTLLALKDVQGIQGSFVLNTDGALLAMEMPSLFEASMFTELGPRIERLTEGCSALGDELESCLVRFSDHMLCIKQFAKGGVLCILTTVSVNVPALKMATNLAHKRLATEIAAASPLSIRLNGSALQAPVGSAVQAPVAPAASAPAPVATKAPMVSADDAAEAFLPRVPERSTTARYYRGQLVEE